MSLLTSKVIEETQREQGYYSRCESSLPFVDPRQAWTQKVGTCTNALSLSGIQRMYRVRFEEGDQRRRKGREIGKTEARRLMEEEMQPKKAKGLPTDNFGI